MFFFFVLSILSLINEAPILDKEQVPTFQTIETSENTTELESRINADNTITSGEFSGDNRQTLEYYACSLTIKNAKFNQLMAFGAGHSAGNGGAIFCWHSTVDIRNDAIYSNDFSKNQAAIGGALALLFSNAIIEKVSFNENTGYQHAGAIYFQGDQRFSTATTACQTELNLIDSNFETNNGGDIGGAILSTAATIVYMNRCKFTSNKARFAGGAMWLLNSPANIFNTHIQKNEVGIKGEDNRFRFMKNGKKYMKDDSYHFRGRGGGGIYFLSSKDGTLIGIDRRHLYTEKVCFTNNKVYHGTNFAKNKPNPGHHLMFDGYTYWNSYNDKFLVPDIDGGEDSYAFGSVSKEWDSKVIENFREVGNLDNCEPFEGEEPSETPVPYPFKSTESSPDGTSSVSDATPYTYVATPITRLPQQTTKSPITFPITKTYARPTTLTATQFEPIDYEYPEASANEYVKKTKFQYYTIANVQKETVNYSLKENFTIEKDTETVIFTSTQTVIQWVSETMGGAYPTTIVNNLTDTYIPTYVKLTSGTTNLYIPYKTTMNFDTITVALVNENIETKLSTTWTISKDTETIGLTFGTTTTSYYYTQASDFSEGKWYFKKLEKYNTLTFSLEIKSLTYMQTDVYNATKCNDQNCFNGERNSMHTILYKLPFNETYTTSSSTHIDTRSATLWALDVGAAISLPSYNNYDAASLLTKSTTTYVYEKKRTSTFEISITRATELKTIVTFVYTNVFLNTFVKISNDPTWTFTKTYAFIETATKMNAGDNLTVASWVYTETDVPSSKNTMATTDYIAYDPSYTFDTNAQTISYELKGTCIRAQQSFIELNELPTLTKINSISTLYKSTWTKVNLSSNTDTVIFTYTATNSLYEINTYVYNTLPFEIGVEVDNCGYADKAISSTTLKLNTIPRTIVTPKPTNPLATLVESLYPVDKETITDYKTITTTSACYSSGTSIPTTIIAYTSTFTQVGNERKYTYATVTEIIFTENNADTCTNVPTSSIISSKKTYTDIIEKTSTLSFTKTQLYYEGATEVIVPENSNCAYSTLSEKEEVTIENPVYSYYTNIYTISSTFVKEGETTVYNSRTLILTPTLMYGYAFSMPLITRIVTKLECKPGFVAKKGSSTTTTISIGDIPSPTPAITPMETPMPSPARTSAMRSDQTYITTQTIYITKTMSNVTTIVPTTTHRNTSLNDNGTYVIVVEVTKIITIVPSEVYTLVYGESMVFTDANTSGTPNKNKKLIIIAAVVSAVIAIILIAVLVWFFVSYSRSSSSSDSVVEMDEETVLHVPDSTSAPITNDNPLWTTSVMGDTDDPFRNDFEEVAAEGFFNERAETVDSDP